eukprot:symbB.v1.2.022549.t1/scaffold2009.1/size92556/8
MCNTCCFITFTPGENLSRLGRLLSLGLQRKGLIRKAPPLMEQKLQSLQQVQQAPSLGLQRKGLIRKAPPLMEQKLQSLQQVQQAPSILTYLDIISHVSASTVFHVFPCIASFDVCWERHADVQDLLLHYFHSWREFVKIGKTTEFPVQLEPSEDFQESPEDSPLDEAEAEDSPLQAAELEFSFLPSRYAALRPEEGQTGKKQKLKAEESTTVGAAAFRRRTRLAMARFAWLKQRRELRFLLSCTLWRWSLTSSRRRCLGARSYLRSRYQRVADWHNVVAAFHRWRSRGNSKRYLVAVDLSDSKLRYHRNVHHSVVMEESPWLRLLQRVAFNAWVGIATAVRKHSSGIVLKDRMELGSIDWLRRRAFSEDRLARNILGELRDETDKLHNAIEDLDFKVRSSQSLQLLRCCWRLWCHGRPWCETALLPLAMRHWLSLALVRWAL